MIFGRLRTGSNYNENEERLTGGRNGFGAKLTNIFSTEFTLETIDAQRKKCYDQTWNDHINAKLEPKITATRNKPYTRISSSRT